VKERRPELAAALYYSGAGAPVVTASGQGAIAARIRELALAHEVPLIENERLVALLCQVPLGDEIPQDLYVAIAEVLAYVYWLDTSLD